jgi:hypothetical protein
MAAGRGRGARDVVLQRRTSAKRDSSFIARTSNEAADDVSPCNAIFLGETPHEVSDFFLKSLLALARQRNAV